MITWVASYPKSGNTYFRLLFNGLFLNHVDINHPHFGTGDLTRAFYQNVCHKPYSELTTKETFLIRPAALFNMKALFQSPLLVKTHNCVGDVDGIALIPGTLTERAFYFVRDPRNVAISFANHLGKSIDETIDVMTNDKSMLEDENFAHVLSDWNSHVYSWTKDNNFKVTVVRYEKLVEKPKEVLKNCCAKMDLYPEEDQLNNAVDSTNFEALKKQEIDKGYVEKPPTSNVFFKGDTDWKTQLTEAQINKIEKSCKPMMDRFEYDTVTL